MRSRRPRPSSAARWERKAVLVTRSEAGMTLVGEGAAVHVPAYPVRVRDVSGAGDTVVAVMAAMLAMQADFESAMRAANAAAAVVVGKRGTATLSVAELRSRILPAATLAPEEKIVFDWALLDEQLAEWRTARTARRLHQWLLRSAASRPRQVAGRRARGLRPPGGGPQRRCVGDPAERRRPSGAAGASARRSAGRARSGRSRRGVRRGHAGKVDRARVKPTVLVKGSDYKREQVVGHEIVEAAGRRGDPDRYRARPFDQRHGRAHARTEKTQLRRRRLA